MDQFEYFRSIGMIFTGTCEGIRSMAMPQEIVKIQVI
jgi:hypothetical protein